MSLNSCFNPLRFDSDVSLSNGGGTVLEKSLDKGDVIPAGFVNLCGVPLAETVSADALKSQIITSKLLILINYTTQTEKKEVLFIKALRGLVWLPRCVEAQCRYSVGWWRRNCVVKVSEPMRCRIHCSCKSLSHTIYESCGC